MNASALPEIRKAHVKKARERLAGKLEQGEGPYARQSASAIRSGAIRDRMDQAAIEALVDAEQEIEQLKRHKLNAIKWANQSVDMLKDAFFPVADALRSLEAYLRETPHHNAPEAAAARKALHAFDNPELLPPIPRLNQEVVG